LGGGFILVVSKAYITKHLKNACNFRLHKMGIMVLVLFLLRITCLLKLTVVLATMFSCFLKEIIYVIRDPFDMSQVLFPNESVPIILARMIGTIGPIDMEMLVSGRETQKYFTDDYDLFHKNEVIVGSYARLST